MSIIGLQDHYRPSSRFTHSKKRKIAQHPDVGALVVAMADGSDDSDDDVPLGLLLRQPQYGMSHLSRSSDDNDSGGAAEGGHVDVDDAAAGGHVDVDGGGDDESDARVGSDEEQEQSHLQPIRVLVSPDVVEAGGRNTYSSDTGLHRLVLGPPRQSFFSTTGPPEATWANLQVSNVTFDRKLVRKQSALPPSVLHDACYHPNSDGDTFTLTAAGLKVLKEKPNKVAVYSRRACSGVSARASRGLAALSNSACSGRPNCRRSCGGSGECAFVCEFREPDVSIPGGPKTRVRPKSGHDCSLVVTETATLEDVHNGVIHLRAQTARSPEAELTALLAEIETEAWAAAVEKEYPVTASSGFLK